MSKAAFLGKFRNPDILGDINLPVLGGLHGVSGWEPTKGTGDKFRRPGLPERFEFGTVHWSCIKKRGGGGRSPGPGVFAPLSPGHK